MSKISFTVCCVEFYANHIGKTGPEVYAAFKESGLLKELDARAPGLLQNEREIHWHLLIFMVFEIFSGLLAEAFRCKELPEQEQFP